MDDLDRVAGTAWWTAAERARETARPDRLFEDPLAEALAGETGRELAERMRGTSDYPGFAIRTRYYDDALGDALGVRGAAAQLVLVAAGLDTRAYRLELPDSLVVFELDRPELLTHKSRTLAELGATPRCARRPVGVDLAEDWASPLTAAGFDPTAPTVWLAEGLIFYLHPAEVYRLFDEITRLSASGSELLTDTVSRTLLDSPDMAPWLDHLATQGVPWHFGTDRPEDDLFEPRGWHATVSLYSEMGARFGRWPGPTFPRDTPGVPQSFLIHATR